jgi:two-component system sensor histidine kinase BarA
LIAYSLWRQRSRIKQGIEAQVRLEAEVVERTGELMASNAKLEEVAQAKSDFLARMSHELRTPMNGVIGMAELLETTSQSAVQTRLTKTIRSSAGVLLHIVNDLLDLSKAQVGKIELESLPIDLAMILEETAALLAAAAAAKGLELTVCPPDDMQRSLLGDPLRIRQVLLNLLSNAIKFTDLGDVSIEANVRIESEGRAIVEINVTDTGIGVPASAIAKIFEPFTQADESMSRRFGGTGLGLAICSELVSLMDGTITVESRLGAGSTFRVMIPLKVQDAPASIVLRATPLLRRVRVMSRKPTLERALTRHARHFGLKVIAGEGADDAPEAGDLLILDAACYGELPPLPMAASQRRALVVVATTTEVEALMLTTCIMPIQIVAKPVQREVLYQAFLSASGARLSALPMSQEYSRTAFARSKGHVLIVEDDAVNAEVAQGYLGALGCTSVWVNSGAAAIARSAAERFDLILMDLNMPDLDGFATAALIRRSDGVSGRAPIVALTAHSAVNYRDTCLAAGLDDLLSKPYTMAACAELLQRWLGGSASESAADPLSDVDLPTVAGLRNLVSSGAGDLYSRLVDLFRRNSAVELTEMGAALAADDLSTAAKIAHKLKASSANVGALAFGKAVGKLESLCIEGKVAAARRHHELLAKVHPRLVETLQGLQMRISA